MDIFKAIVDSTDDEEVIAQARNIIEQQLGKPITIEERQDVNSLLAQDGYILSPGTVVAANVYEPGTKAFNIMSGTIDFGVTAGLDPLNFVGAGIGKVGKAKKAFKTGESLQGVGIIDKAIRKSVHSPTADDYFLEDQEEILLNLWVKKQM